MKNSKSQTQKFDAFIANLLLPFAHIRKNMHSQISVFIPILIPQAFSSCFTFN